MRNRHKYPANWYNEIRPAILVRASFSCEECKSKANTWYWFEQGVKKFCHHKWQKELLEAAGHRVRLNYLQIAHIDQNPANNDLDNLKALCFTCHLKLDKSFNLIKRIMRKK